MNQQVISYAYSYSLLFELLRQFMWHLHVSLSLFSVGGQKIKLKTLNCLARYLVVGNRLASIHASKVFLTILNPHIYLSNLEYLIQARFGFHHATHCPF